MGCKAVTPDLVSLAKRLEGKPFHLVASHCQRNTKENVVSFLKQNGLEPSTPNFTLTSFGGHPKVKGTGYVPYYLVFDHKGNLARHHMGGQWHGGDGKKAMEIVDELIAKILPIDVGEAPYEHFAKEATGISRAHKLGSHLKKLEGRVGKEEGDAKQELERLFKAVRGYLDGEVLAARTLAASEPARALERLESLAKELKKTKFAEAVTAAKDSLESDPAFVAASKLEKDFAKATKKLKACKPCKQRGGKRAAFKPTCAGCQRGNTKSKAKVRKKLLELADPTPLGTRIREFAGTLE